MNNPGGNTRQCTAWESGYRAHNKGLALKDNPHKGAGNVSREWWQKGWEAARKGVTDGDK